MRGLALCALGLALASCGSTTTRTVTRTTSRPATTTAPASSSQTSARTTTTVSGPVYFQGVAGAAAQRPATLELTGDGTLFVAHAQWTSWGGPTATGSGNAIYHGCTPSCAAARTHTAVVSIRLNNIRICSGRRYYAGLTLALSSGRLLDRNFVQRSWSPC